MMKRAPVSKVRLRSIALHGYAGRLVYCGEIFEVGENEVANLISSGRATRLPQNQESAPAIIDRDPPPRVKRTYRRRDLKAEN